MFKSLSLTVFLVLTVCLSKADSPLTSIFPASAYKDVAIINNEIEDETNELSLVECEFLFSQSNPLDQKFALINALGWGDSTKIETYVQFLMKKYGIEHAVFDSILTWRGNQPLAYEPAQLLSADDYSCLAYLLVNGNYFAPLKGYYCAYRAVDLKPQSEAAAYIYGLIMAQFFLDNDWCKVYQVMAGIRNFDGYSVDRLRFEAITNIFEYISNYESSCGNLTNETIIQSGNENYYNKPDKPQKMEDKKNYVDLVAMVISDPEYVDDSQSTRVRVKIKNKGTISSIETNAKLNDLDISFAEAKKRKFDKNWLNAIKENNERGLSEANVNDVQYGKDYDNYWESFQKIPILQPGEEIEIIFIIQNYWIYDSNCEMELFIDFDNNIEEKLENNNSKVFVAWG